VTQRERLLELLAEFGIEPAANDEPDTEHDVTLRAHEGGVYGWNGFLCTFEFDDTGAFKSVGVWE
jgi:hypothetical protein